jgi:hypothetical protein
MKKYKFQNRSQKKISILFTFKLSVPSGILLTLLTLHAIRAFHMLALAITPKGNRHLEDVICCLAHPRYLGICDWRSSKNVGMLISLIEYVLSSFVLFYAHKHWLK